MKGEMRCAERKAHKSMARMSGSKIPSFQKRLEVSEIQFAARNIRADIARAGRSLPSLNVMGATHKLLADNGIDFKKRVKLVRASDLSSPFLAERDSCSIYENEIAIPWDDLIHKTSKHYQAISLSNEKDSNSYNQFGTNNASLCFTSTESITSASLVNIGTSPGQSSCSELKKTIITQPSHIDFPSRPCITMQTSLKLSSEPRLLTLSFYPYTIVHVNAEFARFTGLPSKKVLGRPLTAIVSAESKRLVEASFSMFLTKPVCDIVVNVTIMIGGRNKKGKEEKCINCLFKTSLVGEEPVKNSSCASSNISHFSVEVTPIESDLLYKNQSTDTGSSKTSSSPTKEIFVVG